MKLALTLLPLLLGAATPALQGAKDPRFTVKMDPPQDRENIESDFTIMNLSEIPITAVLIACDSRPSPTGTLRYIHALADGAVDDDVADISPGESATFEVHRPDFSSMLCKQESSVRAVLFADGSSFGESEWVDQIIQSRKTIWQKADYLLNVLQTAKNSGTTKEQLETQILLIERGVYPPKMPDRTDQSPGTPEIYFDVWRNIGRDKKYSKDAPVAQSFVDELSEPILDLRARILYSKPAVPGLPQATDMGAGPTPDFTIKLPVGLGAGTESLGDMVSVFYTLRAKGQEEKSLFDRDFPEKEPKTFRIRTMIAGRPASSLQVAVYAPGCQIKVVNVPDLSSYSGNENFECIKLPTIKFTGQILPSSLLDGKKYKVQVNLDNSEEDEIPWANIYLADDVTPDENGLFQLEIPDFSQDPECVSHHSFLQFFARWDDRGGAYLTAVDGLADPAGHLRLTSTYGALVSFQVRSQGN